MRTLQKSNEPICSKEISDFGRFCSGANWERYAFKNDTCACGEWLWRSVPCPCHRRVIIIFTNGLLAISVSCSKFTLWQVIWNHLTICQRWVGDMELPDFQNREMQWYLVLKVLQYDSKRTNNLLRLFAYVYELKFSD